MNDPTDSPPAPQALYPDEDGVLTPHAVGIVLETNEQYHAGPGISKSHLDAASGKSMRHYWHRYLNPNREPEPQTPAKMMGTALHCAILEPDLFPTEVIESPGFDRRTKVGKAEWEAFQAQHQGKVILEPDDYATCLAMRDAVYSHPEAGPLMRAAGRSELSVYAIDAPTGELIKCRIDRLLDSGSMIIDLKTTDDASPTGFGKSAANYRYPVQTAWYQRVLDAAYGEHPNDWVFLAIEKEPPYALGLYFMEPEPVMRAAIAAQRDFERIVEHRRKGEWPDYGMTPQPLLLPSWSKF